MPPTAQSAHSVVPDFWPGPQLSFYDVHPITLETRTRPVFDGDPAGCADRPRCRRPGAGQQEHRHRPHHQRCLHPVEWSIGEAVGALGEICHRHEVDPADVRNRPELLAELQDLLSMDLGVQLGWPEHIRRRLPESDVAVPDPHARAGDTRS